MSKHLVDIDERALSGARTKLGTKTIRETVNQALRHAGGDRERAVGNQLDQLARAELEDRQRAWR